MMYKITGTFSLRLLTEIVPQIEDTRSLFFPYALMITSVSLKAALMPLFSWLPKAHGTPSAPSIVSAVLSGLYVKGGVYLYIRVTGAVSGAIDTSTFFLVCGIITAIVGFVLAISQTDLKLILSYHSVSQLGLIMLAVNIGNTEAMYGGIYHMLSHALFKSALFLCAGVIIEKYETRNVYEIKGVFRTMPALSIACICAILGITGAPLFNGAISKYMISHSAHSFTMEWLLIFINFGTILSFVKFASIFGGKKQEQITKPPLNRRIVLLVLGIMCLAGGIFGTQVIETIYGIEEHIVFTEYLRKSFVYFVTVGLAIFLFRKNITHNKFFDKLRLYDATFNTIALSLPLFFTILLTYMFITQ